MKRWVTALALAAAWTGLARAEVADRSPAGFEVRETATIAAPRAQVWTALTEPGAWWSSRHSWSGDAGNLAIDFERDCFCELLPGGGHVRHMTVVYTDGASILRLFGGLGPLQLTGAAGHLAVVLKEAQGGRATELTLTYDVGGYAKSGLVEGWAAPVDQVLGEQVGRLKRYVETGRPD